MKRLITFSLFAFCFCLTAWAQNEQARETKIGIYLEPTPQETNEHTYSPMFPPLSLESNRDLFKYFALGMETAFAMYQKEDLNGDGDTPKRYVLKLALKGILQYEPVKGLSVFAGPAIGYTYIISEDDDLQSGVTQKKGIAPFGFAGLDFELTDGFGMFGEAGFAQTSQKKVKSYFKVGFVFRK